MREEGDSRGRRGEQEAIWGRQTDPHFLAYADSGSEHTHTCTHAPTHARRQAEGGLCRGRKESRVGRGMER